MTNGYGFICEEMIRDLLPEIGIPHKHQANGSAEWFWWASRFEDRILGVDCWMTLEGCGEVAVDFTIISNRNQDLLNYKKEQARKRGVVLVLLEQGTLLRANSGSRRALEELGQEIRLQVACKIRQLKGDRMTRERAAQLKAEQRVVQVH